MKKKIYISLMFILCCLVLMGCQCEHEWNDANCTTPKTCSLCGETEGEALGHNWMDATCTKAKSCDTCGATEGSPLWHSSGEKKETMDFISCLITTDEYCKRCDEVMGSEERVLESFVEDGKFLFTAKEFLDRLEYFAKAKYPDFEYEVYTDQTSTAIFGLSFDGKEYGDLAIQFYNRTDGYCVMDLNSRDIEDVSLYISFGGKINEATLEAMLESNDLQMFCNSCEPAFEEEESKNLIATILFSLEEAMSSGTYASFLNGDIKYDAVWGPDDNGDARLIIFAAPYNS